MISGIIKVEVIVISQSRRLRLTTLTETVMMVVTINSQLMSTIVFCFSSEWNIWIISHSL